MKKAAKIVSVLLVVFLVGTLSTQKIFAGEDGTKKGLLTLIVNIAQRVVGEHDQASQAHCFDFNTLCRVGIGVTDPEYTLEVMDMGRGGMKVYRTGTGGSVRFNITNDSRDWQFDHDGGSLAIRDNSAGEDRITIDTSGNVGIGTTGPQYKLDVAGYVRADGYETGDIVFQKDGEKLWRMFEDEEGLYVEKIKNGETFNLHAMQKQLKEQQELILSLAEKVQSLEASLK